jgi:hypothetical protein
MMVQGDISNLDDLDRLFATAQAEKGHVDMSRFACVDGELIFL